MWLWVCNILPGWRTGQDHRLDFDADSSRFLLGIAWCWRGARHRGFR
ncbi:hypothetical protein [Thermithiobacillus plumbiphilus]|uniref:Uncharacterized protein n=1 Tax=Thermithiobacillus plumbiphilus TaxID=1729899 RepID=A0ABU9DD58_9PROT